MDLSTGTTGTRLTHLPEIILRWEEEEGEEEEEEEREVVVQQQQEEEEEGVGSGFGSSPPPPPPSSSLTLHPKGKTRLEGRKRSQIFLASSSGGGPCFASPPK